ncbi:Peroxidase, family 2-domain-containing protein [Mycena belliarum]|uniref:Peroxidase, family 2-domain-containing protein n=1 Tax=Mycena belliarum TaxID=1033014 RepID=A0AAD6XUN8_9AGAR|nr:Peroxidase, family 2-domain-containing protein [Mycena belliae]
MHFKFSTFVFASAVFTAQAFPLTGRAGHDFIPPTSSDIRSPCPALNTLANHGYIPRSGVDITFRQIMDGAKEAYNADWSSILTAVKLGLLSGDDLNSADKINLGALRLHNLIEHDASLSRQDLGDGKGDNVRFSEERFSATIANKNPGVDFYNVSSAGEAMRDALAHSIATNPLVVNTPKELVVRHGESAFYLSVLGDPITGVAPKKFVNVFFREERLPIAEGWKKPSTLITTTTLRALGAKIGRFSESKPSQKCGPFVSGPGVSA